MIEPLLLSVLTIWSADTVELPGPAAGIGAGPGSILVMALSGEEVWEYDPESGEISRLPLPFRAFDPQDLVADEFFIYLYSGEGLFRFRPARGIDSIPLSGAQVGGLTLSEAGDLYIADRVSDRVLQLDRLGRLTQFGPVIPGVAGVLWDQLSLWVLTPDGLLRLDRIGRVRDRFPLPVRADLIAPDGLKGLYLARRHGSEIHHFTPGTRLTSEGIGSPIQDLVVLGSRVFILNHKGKLIALIPNS